MTGALTVVIGGGLVGLATASRLLQDAPGLPLLVLERGPAVGTGQSGHNSGVLHAGLDYAPGSLKARLARSGYLALRRFCEEHGLPVVIGGKLIVAASEREQFRLAPLAEQGRRNGLQGLRQLGPDELREVEPEARGLAALHVPEEGVADFRAVAAALAEEVERLGGRVLLGAEVRRIARIGSAPDAAWVVGTAVGDFPAAMLVACAGLESDRVARLAGLRPPVRIVPFRGDYYRLRAERAGLVRHLLYPVADPRFPFLGVHFTRGVDGVVHAGPNASLAFARDAAGARRFRVGDAASAVAWRGLWRFALRHPGVCAAEAARSGSRRRFAAAAQRLMPRLRSEDLEPAGSGVRAQAMDREGRLVNDFVLMEQPRAVHVLNAPSPAATACLAIGAEVARRVAAQRGLRSTPEVRCAS